EVVNIMSYGAFCKLEAGVEGLVHISEMSWTKRINHPSEVVAAEQKVKVKVLEINKDKQEISLGMKQVEENPWERVAEKYPPGSMISGKVRNVANYGVFVEIEEGIDGLLHVSDLSWTKKIGHPSELLKKGDEVQAVVLRVDSDERKIGLSLKRAQWAQDEEKREEVRSQRAEKRGLRGGLEGGENTSGLSDLKEMFPKDK